MSIINEPKKPGQIALENMRILKSESGVFKVPEVPPKKHNMIKKTIVLDEEEYVKGIAKIIQRDFFPDLDKLQAQNEYLEANENKDYARIRELIRKYSGGSRPPTEPYASPATFDTPGIDRPFTPAPPNSKESATVTNELARNDEDFTEKHSLDSYLAKHTSEDNASYDRLIALENKKRVSSFADQFEAETSSAALVASSMMVPSIEQQADQTNNPGELDTWTYKARNYIMYVPDGGGNQPTSAKPTLLHQNTRLPANPFDHCKNKETITAIAKTQGSIVTGKIGMDGSCSGGDKPRDFSLVRTPTPQPGVGGDVSPLMTWGEVDGTPFRLDGGDTPTPVSGHSYRMLDVGVRERLALQLAEQVAKRRRPTPKPTPQSPSFRTHTERIACMSPAARRLAAKHLLSPRSKLTPNNLGIFSHVATPKTTPTTTKPLVTTPSVNRMATPNRISKTDSGKIDNNLTDNLLQINVARRSRMTAKDFFN